MLKHEFVEPVKLYSAIRDKEYPFILESAEKGGSTNSRYTYIAFDPDYTIEIGDRGVKVDGESVSDETNPFRALKNVHVRGFLVGYISYDAVLHYIGKKIHEPSFFASYSSYFVYDHYLHRLFSVNVENPEAIVRKAKYIEIQTPNTKGAEVVERDGEEYFKKIVERGKEYIEEGEVYQIVLSREYVVKSEYDPFEIYLRLREFNPSPYMFLLEFQKSLIGSSPETMGRVDGRIFKINPIAGTAPRGGNEDETVKRLLQDEKEIAEHVMLVDLARNDVRKACIPGSVKVTKYMDVVKYSSVMHIESEVQGILKENVTHFDAMEAAFPAGTVTGAPKLRAIELIDELERSPRGTYAGAVGYFSENVSDMAIAIRMIEYDGLCKVRAGAGIVADSRPVREFLETESKILRVLQATGLSTDQLTSLAVSLTGD
jgi:anthranilate synthase component 1